MDRITVLLLVACALLAGLVVGGFVASRLARRAHALRLDAALASSGADAQAKLAAAEARLAARDDDVRELGGRLAAADEDARAAGRALVDERVARASLEGELREERERADERLATLAQARDELTAHFRALAADALEANRKRIVEHHEQGLDQILKPLSDKLGAFEQTVRSTYDHEAQQRSALRQEVLNLRDATARINEDAANLTRALKGESKTRGNWGEVVLERVLERSGLVRGVEYQVQLTLRDEHGNVSRPDVVVRLPDAKHVVIDSKVSLLAYDRYHAAEDDAGRRDAGRAHARAVREHVKALAERNYQASKDLDTPDFVALFMPIEPAFGLATAHDETLFLDAWECKVVIVTPSTLLALLTTVHSLWQRDKQTRNAIRIAEEGGKLYDQVAKVIDSLGDLDKKLAGARDAFIETRKRLVDGRGNLVARAERLRQLGVKAQRQMPPDLARDAQANDAQAPYLEGMEPDDAPDDGPPASSMGKAPLTLVTPPAEGTGSA